MEYTKKQKDKAQEFGEKFVEERVAEIEGKTPLEVLTLEEATIVLACLIKVFGEGFITQLMKPALYNLTSLVAYSIKKYLNKES